MDWSKILVDLLNKISMEKIIGILPRAKEEARMRMYTQFMDEVCTDLSFYCVKGSGVWDPTPKRSYTNPNADFSTYSDETGEHHLKKILVVSPMEGVPNHKELKSRVFRKTKAEVMSSLKDKYPRINYELRTLFERGWCYHYDIQKAFKVPTTHKYPYGIQ